MLLTKRFELVELQVPVSGANAATYFQNQPQLQSIDGKQTVFVRSIEVFSVQSLADNPLTAGSPVATAADIINATLTLCISGTESIKRLPLAVLSRVLPDQTNYVPAMWQPFLLKDTYTIDWSKSYVTNSAAVGSAFSFLFGVHYLYWNSADNSES